MNDAPHPDDPTSSNTSSHNYQEYNKAKSNNRRLKTIVEDRIIGKNLRWLRRQRHISQTRLGQGLGVSFQQIQKYEQGENRLSLSLAIKACKVLRISPVDFMRILMYRHKPTTISCLASSTSTVRRQPEYPDRAPRG